MGVDVGVCRSCGSCGSCGKKNLLLYLDLNVGEIGWGNDNMMA